MWWLGNNDQNRHEDKTSGLLELKCKFLTRKTKKETRLFQIVLTTIEGKRVEVVDTLDWDNRKYSSRGRHLS